MGVDNAHSPLADAAYPLLLLLQMLSAVHFAAAFPFIKQLYLQSLGTSVSQACAKC